MDLLIIATAAFGGGVVNAIAGGGTLISFPTLVWLGRDPVLANATNSIGLWPASLTGMLGFRQELKESGPWLALLTIPALAGGITGAVLLLNTPTATFEAIVPWLVLLATILLAVQEPLSRLLGRPDALSLGTAGKVGAVLFQAAVGVYGGYFGAGIGILMLAALGLLGLNDLHQMNGIKNLLALCINGIAILWFALQGAVLWGDAAVMAVGAAAGGWAGAGLARRVGRRAVRYLVVAIGTGMAIALALRS